MEDCVRTRLKPDKKQAMRNNALSSLGDSVPLINLRFRQWGQPATD